MTPDGTSPTLPPARVDPARTRFLVIDVQNDFCAEGGWFDKHDNDLRLIHEAVDRLVGFTEVARKAGVPPIFIRAIYDEIYLSPHMLERHARTGLGIDHCQSGTWGAEFFRVAPAPGELVMTKRVQGHRVERVVAGTTRREPDPRGHHVECLRGVDRSRCLHARLPRRLPQRWLGHLPGRGSRRDPCEHQESLRHRGERLRGDRGVALHGRLACADRRRAGSEVRTFWTGEPI
jgi:hypothetical protein